MSLLALGRNGRSQAGAEASGLDSLIPPSSHIPFLVSRRGVECEFRNVCHELFCVLAIVTCGYNHRRPGSQPQVTLRLKSKYWYDETIILYHYARRRLNLLQPET